MRAFALATVAALAASAAFSPASASVTVGNTRSGTAAISGDAGTTRSGLHTTRRGKGTATRSGRTTLRTGVASAAAASVTAAASGPTVCASPGCVQPDSNVLFDTDMTGPTVMGSLNNYPGVMVNFTGNESLTTTASNGQARISGSDGSLNLLTFTLADGATFSEAEFNLNALTDGFATITFLGTGGTTLFVTDPLAISANGQNFFGLSGGDFTGVTISSTVDLGDVRQIRLGGITLLQSAVPEPGTWAMMLLGFGAIGLGLRNPRRRQMAQLA